MGGDRCGVIDDKGDEIYSDKIGLLIARNLASKHQNSKFIVDVKSTGLYSRDKVLLENKCKTIYWKTGHSLNIKTLHVVILIFHFFVFHES